jgi:hypothetical protein
MDKQTTTERRQASVALGGTAEMRGRKSRLAKLLSIPVLAACGFVIAATVAGGGLFANTLDPTTGSTPGSGTPTPAPSPTPTSPPTTTPTPTTTSPPTTTPPPKLEGCSPGFWKKHLKAWSGYSPTQTLGDVFTGLEPAVASRKLLDALKKGGGGLNALMRHAVGALLNAASVDYPLTTGQIIDMVNAAIASHDKDTIESLKDTLDEFNNLGAAPFC